ncbi:MAG: hypothetical protein JSS97_16905 [Actinobacteria bacterium]|nr:hypothetical protein [Actinomycetota bacterium]
MSRAQLRRLGMSDRGISNAAARGWLRPVFHGVFSVGHEHLTASARLLAATLACGEGTVVSHGTAAWLFGMAEHKPEAIDVIAPVEGGRKIAGIRRRFVPLPTGREIWRRQGVPVTSAARTIVDCAGSDPRRVGALVEQAAVLRLLDLAAIDRILEGPRRRGTKHLRRVLEPCVATGRASGSAAAWRRSCCPCSPKAPCRSRRRTRKSGSAGRPTRSTSSGTGRGWWSRPTAADSTTTHRRGPGTAAVTEH